MALARNEFVRLQIAVIVILCAHFKFVQSFTARSNINSSPSLRLPNTTLPENYHLQIATEIHRDILEYTGTVSIILSVLQSTEEIVLHANKLGNFEISLMEYDVPQVQKHENLNYSHDNETSFLRIYSPMELKAGQRYRLHIHFVGNIQSETFGFYKTTYTDDRNSTIPLAATQFETTNARMAFPCFDEPAFKATFRISITHGNHYSAISNMPAYPNPRKTPDGQMTTTHFRTTPLMSTYLVAFVVSNYEQINKTVNGVEYRVSFPPKSNKDEIKVLENAIKTVTAFGNYLGTQYSLPKLDFVRLNKTYGLAMENWGLITYNYDVSLSTVNGEVDSDEDIIKNTLVQNHEIAHQWFGNLVSPKWWTYAWLNEGFATYFGYHITELVHPDWNIAEAFIENEVNAMLAWSITHAITQYVEKEGDIKSSFDVVCYRKSSSVIKMFHHAIGTNTFMKGISGYLNKFKFSVADEDDLFASLQTAIDKDKHNVFKSSADISSVFYSWTHNLGIPMVTAIRNYDAGTITFRQKSYTDEGGNINENFWIPLNFATKHNPNFEQTRADMILPPYEEFTVSLNDINLTLSNDEWLILNKQQTGLFYVAYDDRNLELIAKALNTDHKQIPKLNRALLLRDIKQFLKYDTDMILNMNVDPILSILNYLKYEKDPMPWRAASDLITNILNKLNRNSSAATYEKFKAFIREIVEGTFQEFVFDRFPVTQTDVAFRSKILELACKVDLPECLDVVKNLTVDYFFYGQPIEDPARDIVLCQGIKDFTVEDLSELIQKISRHSINSELYDDIVYAVRCLKRPDSIHYFLSIARPTFALEAHYLTFLFVANHQSRPYVVDFFRAHHRELLRTPEAEEHVLTKMGSFIPENGSLREKYDDLFKTLIGHFPNEINMKNLKMGSRVKSNHVFVDAHEQNIKNWLLKSSFTGSGRSLRIAWYIITAGLLIHLLALM